MNEKSVSAARRESKAVERWSEGVLFVGLGILLIAYYGFDVTAESHPILDRVLAFAIAPIIVGPLLIWIYGKRRVIRRHAVACPRCAAIPPLRNVNEMLETNRCPGCDATIVASMPRATEE
jgi:hypothetical protein